MREPGVCFYEHVLKNIGVRPEKVIFVDEKLENVMSAQSLGMKGIQFQDPESLAQILENLLGDSVRRGEEFLMKNTGKFHSVSDNGVEILENFSQLLILDITHDEYANVALIYASSSLKNHTEVLFNSKGQTGNGNSSLVGMHAMY